MHRPKPYCVQRPATTRLLRKSTHYLLVKHGTLRYKTNIKLITM